MVMLHIRYVRISCSVPVVMYCTGAVRRTRQGFMNLLMQSAAASVVVVVRKGQHALVVALRQASGPYRCCEMRGCRFVFQYMEVTFVARLKPGRARWRCHRLEEGCGKAKPKQAISAALVRSLVPPWLVPHIAAGRSIRGTNGRPRHNLPPPFSDRARLRSRHGAASAPTRCGESLDPPVLLVLLARLLRLAPPIALSAAAVFTTVLGPPLPRRLLVLPSGDISRSPQMHSGPVLDWCAASLLSSSSSSSFVSALVPSSRPTIASRARGSLSCCDQSTPSSRRSSAGMDGWMMMR
jgi:hypothetical protein